MDKITIYEKPTCSKCREADKLLRESGADYEKINYIITPIGEAKLRELIGKMGIAPTELLRTGEPAFRALGLNARDLSDEEIIALLVAHPELLQRPIVERGARAVLGRPTENIRALL
jgi:arsenate reductase